jgi:hypothetical protein
MAERLIAELKRLRRAGIKGPTRDQQTKINSGERRRSTRLVGALEPYAQSQGFNSGHRLGDGLPGRFKDDEVRCGPRSRSAPKRAILEMIVNSRVMM